MNTLKEFNVNDKKHRLLRISSEDKQPNGTNSRFKVALTQSGGAVDRVSAFRIKYASVPNIFYNVPTYANTLQIIRQTGGVVYNITVEPNQYNITDLITELQNKINTAIAPDTVVISLTNQSKLNFVFNPDAFSLNKDNSTISDIIGLSENTPFFLNLTLSNPVNLTGETEVYIHSRALHQNGLTEATGNFSVVDVIPLNVSYGATAYITYPDSHLSQINYEPYETQKSLRVIDIVLRNRKGDVLELPSNFYFTLMLKIYHD